MRTCVIVAVLAACCVDEVAASQSAVRPLFKSVCSECHGAESQESGLRLDTLSTDFTARSRSVSGSQFTIDFSKVRCRRKGVRNPRGQNGRSRL